MGTLIPWFVIIYLNFYSSICQKKIQKLNNMRRLQQLESIDVKNFSGISENNYGFNR